MGLSSGAIVGIVIAATVVVVILLYLFIRWYTWKRAKRFNPEQQLVKIDPNEYSGTWYEVARYPQKFEKGCQDVTANYQYDKKTNRLRIVNRCHLKDGTWKEAHGWAYPTGRDGQLAVEFFPGVYGNYSVVKREPDISVVSNPEKSSLWVLSRKPVMEDKKRKSIFYWLHKNGYDLSKLEYPVQKTQKKVVK